MQFWEGCQGFFDYINITLTGVWTIFSPESTPNAFVAFDRIERR